ncbi:MAG: hypothetical protein QOG61_574 [Candidatus Binataceae bacterium]|nr:hypothetical protein [Candidatus Binataceae bacterium]
MALAVPNLVNQKQSISPGIWLIAILAILGLGAPLIRSSAPPNVAPPQPSAKNETATNYEHSALDLVEEFFDADPDQFDTTRPWSHDRAWPPADRSWGDDPRGRDHLGFLIATLPDPSFAPLRYEFDSYLGALQSALGADGYLLDRFDLPWLTLSSDKSFTDASAAKAHPEGTRRAGVMLFRKEEPAHNDRAASERLLVVLIVGETPTAGIDAAMLHDALGQIGWLNGWNGGASPAPQFITELTRGNPHELAIIGPSFSGSAISLQVALRTWLATAGTQARPNLRILSGTATAIEQWPDDLGEFRTMQVPDRYTESEILRFLGEDLGERRVAILAEDTSFGRSLRKPLAAGKSSSASRSADAMWLPFPLHISDLRTAYGDSSPASKSTTAGMPTLSRRDVPLGEEAAGSATDIVPSFSQGSAAYEQLVLANVLATLHREHIRYVGIIATDIRDVVFLVHVIRENCPDTIPFVTSADLLYLHSEFNHDLMGMLVFSTYPLFSMNQVWTAPFAGNRDRIQFSSGEAEGIYNAALVALDRREMMLDYATPFSVESDSAPLWMSLVGSDSLWPVWYRPISISTEVYFRRPLLAEVRQQLPINLRPSLYPRSFEIAFIMLSAICLAPNLMLLRRFPLLPRVLTGFYRLLKWISPRDQQWLDMFLSDSVIPTQVLERRLCLLSFNLVLLIAYIVAASVFMLPLRTVTGFSRDVIVFGGVWSWPRVALIVFAGLSVIVIGAIVILGTITLSIRTLEEARRPDRSASLTTWITAAASVIGAGLAVGFAISIWTRSPTAALFYFLRGANLDNGVSPLRPLLFLGIAALFLSICDLTRLNLLEECIVTTPFLGFAGEASFKGADHHESRIATLLRCRSENLPNWALWVMVPPAVFLYFGFLGLKPIPVDGRYFGIFFASVAIFVYTAFLTLFARFVSVWIELRRLLRRFYFHPSRRAYEELRVASVPPTLAERQRIRLFEPRTSVTALEFCLERVRELIRRPAIAETAPHDSAAPLVADTLSARVANARDRLAAEVSEAEGTLTRLLECQADGDWRSALDLKRNLQSTMATLAAMLANIFEPQWRLLGQPRLVADSSAGTDAQLLVIADLFVASRTVDFLRQVFPQLLNLVFFSTAGLLAMMLAASTYPFPQHDTIAWLSWTMLLIVVGVMILIFAQINRDRVISMLSGTTPGELNWNGAFVSQLVTFGVIPILTLLGAQFPYTLQRIFSWLGSAVSGQH